MSSSPLASLPPPPDGVNPYAYWSAIARGVLYRRPSDIVGFDARLIILCILLVYLIVAAIVSLVVTLADYRRRGKQGFLWKLVRRERGRYIVGNQQLLEPILTIAVAIVFLAHTIVDWRWTFGHGTYATIAPLRLATWSILFVQLWIVSWASLQSFVITAGEGNIALRYFSARVANTVFLLLGTLFVIFLIIGISFGAYSSHKIWQSYTELQGHLYAAIPAYPAAVDDATASRVVALWSGFLSSGQDTVRVMRVVVIEFAVSASLTALANIGGIALLLLVRRQISSNYGNFVGATTQPEFHLPTLVSGAHGSAPRDIEVDARASGESESAATHESAPGTPQAPPGAFALSITPATPLVTETRAFSTPSSPDQDETPTSSRKSSLGSTAGDPSPAGSSADGQKRRKSKKRRPPSRSTVRRIAGNEAGGVAAAQARNLQQLHRAESDLFITCCSSISTSIAFTALSSWVYVIIPTSNTLTWGEVEVGIFLGSWLYAVIHGIALSAHLYTLLQNFSRSPKPVPAHSTEGYRPESFINTSWRGTPTVSVAAGTSRSRAGASGPDDNDDERQDPTWLSPGAARRDGDGDDSEESEEPDTSLEMRERVEKDGDEFEEVRLPVVTP
ncbi:hypothetical protein JCM6882_006297 [Rhodosporidiobolus microsporus]